ncbi:MAG: protein kinase [Gemmatimonadales bacterium]
MTPPEGSGGADWARVAELFERALDLPAGERAAWVESAAAGDRALLEEVRGLLAAHDRSGLLDGPAPLPPGPEALREQLTETLADRYAIGETLGEGGMAVVFLAREIKHDRAVVIKALRPEVATWLGADRFLSEIQIAARLSHPHILALIDSGDADGVLYYVMPYVGGETLRGRLEDGPLGVDEARTVLRDLADALAHAHRNQIVHRDLKPENVLVVGGHAFLMDFGVAKLRPATGEGGRTAEGLLIGTPAYMSPEQAAGARVDSRADVFAWGLLAREALLGRLSRDASLSAERPDVPLDLVHLIETATREDVAARPADGAAILAALEATTTSVGAPAEREPGRWRRLWPLGLVGVVGAIATVLLTRPSGPLLDDTPGPVAVSVFRNETGDSTLTTFGRMAGDWITQGLQETGRIKVVPWPMALQALDGAVDSGQTLGAASVVEALRAGTGAGTVVTGAYYAVGQDLRFQVELIDAASGTMLGALPAVDAPRDSIERAMQLLRQRVMGALAVQADDRLAGTVGPNTRPPTYEAYRLFERGISLYNQLDYRAATSSLLEAWNADTTFLPSLVHAARAMLNSAPPARTDSLVRAIRGRQARLTAISISRWSTSRVCSSDIQKALSAARQAAELARPAGRAITSPTRPWPRTGRTKRWPRSAGSIRAAGRCAAGRPTGSRSATATTCWATSTRSSGSPARCAAATRRVGRRGSTSPARSRRPAGPPKSIRCSTRRPRSRPTPTGRRAR